MVVLNPILSGFDLQNLLAYFKKPQKTNGETYEDYTIIVPVFGKPEFLQNLAYLTNYKSRVVIASLKNQNEVMMTFLSKLVDDGFTVKLIESDLSLDKKPNEVETYNVILKQAIYQGGKEKILKGSVDLMSSKYTCFLDADSLPSGNIGSLCAVLEEGDFDLTSVKILPTSKKNFIERMQHIEYSIAMRARHYRPWLTSGACMVGKTEVLKEIMEQHSLFFAGGDVEVGMIARMTKKKIAFTDFSVYTDVPSTFRSWFRQRRNWWCGTFRLNIVNIDRQLNAPFFLFYMTGLSLLAVPLKVFGLFQDIWIYPLMFLLYVPLTILVNWPVRDRWMIVYPLYAGFQALVLPVFGLIRYLNLFKKFRRNGRIRLRRSH